MAINRRAFIQGCCAAAGASILPWTGVFDLRAMAAGSQHNVLIYLFLRGGIDGLHLVVPYAGSERTAYESKRVNGSVNLAIPVDRLRQIAPQWGLHPRMGGAKADAVTVPAKWLHRRFNEGRLAIVNSAGISTLVNRSHFDAQSFMDLGTPGSIVSPSGWLTRYLMAANNLPEPLISSAFGLASNAPKSLRGQTDAIVVNSPPNFSVDGFHSRWRFDNSSNPAHQGASSQLFKLWLGNDLDHLAPGRVTAESLEILRAIDFSGYQPEGGAQYPGNTLGKQLKNLAQLIKLDTGLVASTLNVGGWDNHANIGMPQPGNPNHGDSYGDRVETLSRALDAFYTDLSESVSGDYMQRVNVVVLSEFGRRVRPNQSAGTDHGYGNVMLALGGRVNGGLHGSFTGLDDASLLQGQDVDVSTDYRQVLSEMLVRRMGLPASRAENVFPGLGGYSPIGVFQT